MAAVLFLSVVSCVVWSDEDVDDAPDVCIAKFAYYEVFPELFRSAEMADFFSAYQSVREDRDKSIELWEDYFGEFYGKLYYEEAEMDYPWGMIRLADGHDTYMACPVWTAPGDEYVVSGSGGVFTVKAREDGVVVYEAKMSVKDGVVSVDELVCVMDDGAGTKVEMTVVEPVAVPRCSEGDYTVLAVRGKVDFVVRGKVNDEFSDKYFGNGTVGHDGIRYNW